MKEIALDPNSLLFTQTYFDCEIAQKYIKEGTSFGTSNAITVVKYQNRFWVVNGHHRVVAAIVRCDPTILVKVEDLDSLLVEIGCKRKREGMKTRWIIPVGLNQQIEVKIIMSELQIEFPEDAAFLSLVIDEIEDLRESIGEALRNIRVSLLPEKPGNGDTDPGCCEITTRARPVPGCTCPCCQDSRR